MRRAGLLLAAAVFSGCAPPDDRSIVRVIDLLQELPRAETRPVDGVFQVAEYTRAGVRHPGIDAPAPSRLIWTVRFPARAVLRTNLAVVPNAGSAVIVDFRVGVSDERLYEPLAQQRVASSGPGNGAWVPLSADLSPYAGRKWSVFYRPDSQPWRLVLSADRVAGSGRAFWGLPGVDADLDAAREWRRRQ